MVKLYAPIGYWQVFPYVRQFSQSACGTPGLGDLLVPDSLLGVSIYQSCNIHDYMYRKGRNYKDKEEADRVFLWNMLRQIVDKSSNKFALRFRKMLAVGYYLVVKYFGGPAYWNTKNSEMHYRDPEEVRPWKFDGSL